MTREDINNIISTICPNDEDFEKPIISPAYLKKELEALALEQEPKAGWIPVSERLPERAKDGCSNWHTDDCIVCMYGKGIYDSDPDEEDYEILTGYFIEYEDEETGKKDLCFVPDRFTLFIPDEWDFFNLDNDFKSHFSEEECMYYVDDSCIGETEFHDRYYQVLAWMPLPEPYKEG